MRINSIGIEINDSCNFECTHCYVGNKCNNNLTLENVVNIFSMVKNMDFLTVYLTGGEPMLNKDFLNIYEYIVKEGYLVSIFTNCSMLSDTILHAFSDRHPMCIEVSIYGMSNDVYENVTNQKNVYNSVIKNITKLLDKNINIKLKYVLMKNNICDFDLFINFCRSNTLNFSINPATFPIRHNGILDKSFRLDRKIIVELFKKHNMSIKTIDEHFECDAGHSIYIDSKMNIKGCPVLLDDICIYSNVSLDFINDFRRKLINQYKEALICPAWSLIEDSSSINNYLNN